MDGGAKTKVRDPDLNMSLNRNEWRRKVQVEKQWDQINGSLKRPILTGFMCWHC